MSKDIDPQEKHCSRREFLSTALAAPIFATELSSSFQSNNVSVASPDGRVRFEILPREQSRLGYRVTFRNRVVIEASSLGIVIDGADLGQGVEIGKAERYRLDERYAWRGVHSEAVNRCNGVKFSLKRANSGAGFAAITEAALVNYAGMGFQADGRRGFNLRLGHAHPASYPFRLRYAADVERLKQPAAMAGTIATPWRVVMIGDDLNALVNCDIVHDVSPPPDNKLFPAGIKTDWLKPGRAVWKYLDGGENTLEEVKNFSQLAGQLGFEYQVVEGFWSRWSEAQMREAVDFSRERKVGLLFWKHSRDLRTPDARKQFFDLCQRIGVAGAKIDFFDHEAKEIIDLYQTLLRESAERRLIIDFHGANKPAGEARMWPNEMTREGIYGLEHRRTEAWGPVNTTLPFTRLLAGHADYTPVIFGERRKETSWAHQIASAAIFTSPLLIYGAHPKSILDNPAVEIIKSIPSVWDETIALPQSEIGELAAFARRSGATWFLAIMNGPTARTIKIPLTFLGAGKYQGILARDQQDEAATVKIENVTLSQNDSLTIELRAGGGFIARFSK